MIRGSPTWARTRDLRINSPDVNIEKILLPTPTILGEDYQTLFRNGYALVALDIVELAAFIGVS